MATINVNQVTAVYPGYNTNWGIEQFLFSAQGNKLQHSRKADKIVADAFGTQVHNSLPGLRDGSLKINGLSTMDRGTLNWQLSQWFGRKSAVNAWFAFEGLQLLAPITTQPSSVMNNSVTANLKDAVDFDVELSARGAFEDGIIALSPATLLSGASGTGPLIDDSTYTGATTSGAVGVVHMWGWDAGTTPSTTVTIQHSPDGTSWTNLMSFTAMSALGSQRITIAPGVTVNQKIQAIWTNSGSPTASQVLASFARLPNLNV